MVFNGVWDGLNDDVDALGELAKLVWSPIQTSSEIYHVFKEITLDDMGDLILNMVGNLLNDADNSVTWRIEDNALFNDLASRAYIGSSSQKTGYFPLLLNTAEFYQNFVVTNKIVFIQFFIDLSID